MDNQKPQNIDEYKKWLKNKLSIDISDKIKRQYETVTVKIKQDFETSDFWKNLIDNLQEYNEEYLVQTGYYLLLTTKPELLIKPFESVLLKTFRQNIIDNEKWPAEPMEGWVLPSNWYTKIRDIIRTLLVVKYLDGVKFINDKIASHCQQYTMKCIPFWEAREEGYYAAHLYTEKEFEVPKIDWDTEKINVSIEIQITTQLQESIRKLLHKYYEKHRKDVKKEEIKWQWNYKSDEFIANYLGHILHYVEGMIMEIREKQKEEIYGK